jgi:glycosyltransferase involved in cell wall biosynthesis|tara:strand:+ start:3817 stop:5007 length:1191 start_codon:yes stop_codon:yes gene_type:complete
MIIWLINPGEPLPVDDNQRLLRTGKLAYMLKDKNQVLWFSSKFNHFTKSFRKEDKTEFENIKYYFIKSIGYKNNLSLRRIIDHVILGFNLFFKLFKMKQKPDIIITSYPPIETSFFVFLFCKINNIKLICDVRDLWPYTFTNLFKKKIYKLLCKIVILPWILISKIIFKNTKIITISDSFAKWLQKTSNKKVERFYHSYEKKIYTNNINNFKNLKISEDDFIISFFGNYSEVKFDFDTVFKSSNEISDISKNIKFIFCGDLKNININNLHDFSNIYFFDWINKKDLRELLNITDLGLAPYKDLWDFNMSIPNKISEYLCYEIPILSSLKGDTSDLIKKYKCGVNYNLNNKDDFIKIIKKIYEDKLFYKELQNGAKKASQNFTEETVLPRMANLILD